MMRALMVVLVLGLGVSVAGAGVPSHADLGTLEEAVDARFHLHAQHVPLMFMVSGIARAVTGGGVRGMRVIQYENLPGDLDRGALTGLVRGHLGQQWTLMVREYAGARKDEFVSAHEDSVWVQPAGERMRMLVVSLDANELDLVQMELNPEQLARWKREHWGKGGE